MFPSDHSLPVVGTGLIGWILNIVLVLCSGPLYVDPATVVLELTTSDLQGRPAWSLWIRIPHGANPDTLNSTRISLLTTS
jgi:hypothetical protein